jgi:hypothetical protein
MTETIDPALNPFRFGGDERDHGVTAMRNLTQGDRGADVMFLQRMLNKRGASPRLGEDGDFGPRTRDAVIAFQRNPANRIAAPANGIADGRLWPRLGLAVEHVQSITLVGQPTNMTCWSAAATMMLGSNMSVGSGSAQTGTAGDLSMPIDNIETFLGGLGWRLINNMSAPPVDTFASGLSRGPLWVGFEGGHFRHAVVISAIWSDNTDDGTVMRVHDPWPVGSGTIYGTPYVNRRIWLRSVRPAAQAIVQYVAASR